MKWKRGKVIILISLYRQNDCLWNKSHEDYNSLDIKSDAWLDIARTLNKNVREVKKKIKHLRSAYVSEKRKIKASKDTETIYSPTLYYFKKLDFLSSEVILRKRAPPPVKKKMLIRSFNSKVNLKKHKHKIAKWRSLRESKCTSAINEIVDFVKQTQPPPPTANESSSYVEDDFDDNNAFDVFGKTIALQLQQLSKDRATEAMAAIYQLLAKKMLLSSKKSPNIGNSRFNGLMV